MRTWILLASALLACAPGASAQGDAKLTVVLIGEHSADHVMKIPENRRAAMDFAVALEGTAFLCPQATKVTVEGVLDYESTKHWAGASLNPISTQAEIPATGPLAEAKKYEASAPLRLEMFWDEAYPAEGASVTYEIRTKTTLEGCLPQPKIEEATATVDAEAPARATVVEDPCAEDECGDLCEEASMECEVTPPQTPGWGPFTALGIALVAVVCLRRQRS